MAGETILVVDDDTDIREIVTMYLEKEGYQVITAEEGKQGLACALTLNPDLIILDMMMPGLDGIEVCQEIRKELMTPIIFLSCKGTPIDKSMGLTAGGDDYMSKPFDGRELLARVKAHLRRNRMVQHATNQTVNQGKRDKPDSVLKFPGLTIDLNSYSVTANEKPITLSPKELQLLVLLAQNSGTVFSREQLFKSLWGTDSLGDHRTVMVHISNIRRKIEQDPANPIFIETVKGIGYRFNIP